MNWLLGFIGAMFGAGLGESGNLLGAVSGFFALFLLASVHRLRREVAALVQELTATRLRIDLLSAKPVEPKPAATPAPPAPEAAAPPPRPVAVAVPATVEPSDVAARVAAATVLQPEAAAQTPAPRLPPARPARPASPERASSPSYSRQAPSEPGWQDRLGAKIKSWFTEGNVPVKIGVLVLLFGVAAALRYAAAAGYFTMPIEVRVFLIAGAALAGLVVGWRERLRRPGFGLSLQGGAIGVLQLTVYASYKLYHLLPPTLAFVLVVVLVAGSALLAVLQENMALAVLGFLGGYLAPVLISTGSANHVALFSYYAVLNAAVFAISWRQSWRLLNLIGFAFTFGVGTAWGSQYYRPELFGSVEPFLILFFLFYIVIGLLYVVRQTQYRRPWVDGTLVFGTPLVAFPLQAAMLKDDRFGMAFSALFVALVYALLVWWLRKRRGERLLTEAYGALALGFATLAVPLALSASTTASVWALEGAGVAWLGIRQNRTFPWISGLALQLLAAGAYLLSLDHAVNAGIVRETLLLNAQWLGAALLAFSGFTLSLIHERHRPARGLPSLLFAWGVLWWLAGGIGEFDRAAPMMGEWRFAMLYLSAALALAVVLRSRLAWLRMNWIVALAGVLALAGVFRAQHEFTAALAIETLPTWLVYAVVMFVALRTAPDAPSRSNALAHLCLLVTATLAATLQLKFVSDREGLAQGWEFVCLVVPVAVMTLGLWRRPDVFAWPRRTQFVRYGMIWFGLALPLLMVFFVIGLFLEGSSDPLLYLPLLNPLELGLVGIALLCHGALAQIEGFHHMRRAWPAIAFAFVTMATLRAVHHWHGEPWSGALLSSGFTQASLTVVWSLIGVSAWILGSRRLDRRVWMGGAILMGFVLLKLALIDRTYMGNIPGIVSVMAVGLLLVGVGYIAPSPPRLQETGGAA